MHENKYLPDDYWIRKCLDTVDCYLSYAGHKEELQPSISGINSSTPKWTPPPRDTIKLNVDANLSLSG